MRYLDKALAVFASQKLVLLCGPRQVGKTTLSNGWLEDKSGRYLNWDIPADREILLDPSFARALKTPALVLDEIHKYSRWKSWLKGLFDAQGKHTEIVVTGSARLDIFQRGGDSLQGRYELLRLHPFSVGELTQKSGTIVPPPKNWLTLSPDIQPTKDTWAHLERRSGFPEPFIRDNEQQHRRWSTRRRDLLIREDVRELTQVRTLSLVEHLSLLLPARVAAPLSMNSLREELQVAFDTVKSWLDILERLYFCFRVSPFSKKIARSLKKEQKLYLWDWSQVADPGARFENMVASHLLKAVHAWNDLGYGDYGLHYWRDLERREVDFVLTESHKPIALFECKKSDEMLAPPLLRLGEALGEIPQIQLIDKRGVDRVRGRTRVVDAAYYLAGLV